MINIPIYRAEKTHYKEEYIEGLLSKEVIGGNEAWFITNWGKHRIKKETLAINFPDMKDSNDKPIFASLSESGKGGDILDFSNRQAKCMYVKGSMMIDLYLDLLVVLAISKIKVIGIHND